MELRVPFRMFRCPVAEWLFQQSRAQNLQRIYAGITGWQTFRIAVSDGPMENLRYYRLALSSNFRVQAWRPTDSAVHIRNDAGAKRNM